MAELSIYLFGSVRVLQSDQELRIRPASRMLLLYLLLHRLKHHRREELSTLFWGDTSDAHARRCLNSALWRLRQDFTDTNLINSNVQGDVVLKLQENCYLDVVEFENLALSHLKKSPEFLNEAEIKNLEQAVAIYHGDLAENCYYDWILPERERFRALYLDVLSLLMQAHSHHRSHAQAIRIGQQILQMDPLREDIHRHLIRLYIATDQRNRALQQYMTCWQLLQSELHLTPIPETTALYEEIVGKEPFPGLATAPVSTPLASTSLSAPHNLDHLVSLLHTLQAEIQNTLHAIDQMTTSH